MTKKNIKKCQAKCTKVQCTSAEITIRGKKWEIEFESIKSKGSGPSENNLENVRENLTESDTDSESIETSNNLKEQNDSDTVSLPGTTENENVDSSPKGTVNKTIEDREEMETETVISSNDETEDKENLHNSNCAVTWKKKRLWKWAKKKKHVKVSKKKKKFESLRHAERRKRANEKVKTSISESQIELSERNGKCNK